VFDVPTVREKQDVKVPFTEKKFPHLPARESHMKEAPYPKSKQIDKKKDDVYIDIEDKDPVWLKDKGDHFYNRNDYQSALNAYTKALEADKEFLMGRLNRATTWLKVRAF
jgi:dyslexia susceptibility 1 candidate gene 1 protein